jgi:hypothetical protein
MEREKTITEEAAEYSTFKDFLIAKFELQELEDMASHGTDSGWAYLTYTRDTVELHDAYESDLWDLLSDEAESYGAANVLEFMAGFNRADMAYSADGLKNLIVWFAAEHYANMIVDDPEEAYGAECDYCGKRFIDLENHEPHCPENEDAS